MFIKSEKLSEKLMDGLNDRSIGVSRAKALNVKLVFNVSKVRFRCCND